MRVRFALLVFALAASQAGMAAAQSTPAYYCDPLRVYYPTVPTCPVPWRIVNPPPAAATNPSSSQNSAFPSPPSSIPPGFPGPGEPLYEWCTQEAKLPSSVALCSDAELRSLAIERQKVFNEVR